MDKYLQMADGFDFDEAAIEQRLFGGCISKEEATYAAHAIVSHDELVSMNQELLEALEDVLNCGRGSSGRIILDDFDEQCLVNAIAKAKGGAA